MLLPSPRILGPVWDPAHGRPWQILVKFLDAGSGDLGSIMEVGHPAPASRPVSPR